MYTVHNALAKILGIDTKGDVIGFDVHAHAGSLVRVVIHKVLLNEAYEMLDPHRMEFELVELTKKPEPFDLDKMCEERPGMTNTVLTSGMIGYLRLQVELMAQQLPEMPAKDALCHNNMLPQNECARCSRIRIAHDALKNLRINLPLENDPIGQRMVLVEAYAECGKYVDDNPGLRHDCARKLAQGRPCEKCPSRIGKLT